MSDEKDVPAPDDRDVSTISEYGTPENLSFRTENVTPRNVSFTPIKSSVLEKTPQQEATDIYFSPFEENFLQWRCIDATTPADASLVSNTSDVATPKISAYDMSLITRMSKLCLFTPKNIRSPASTSTGTETILLNMERTPEKSIEGAERNAILGRDDVKDEFAVTEVTSSDYSTMRLEMTDKDSSSKITCDNISSIDQFSSGETRSGASQEDARFPSDFAEAETKVRNTMDAEPTHLLDDSTSASSYNQPSTLRDDEVYETDTFDTFNAQYNQNVALTRRYVEKMITKEDNRNPSVGCFRRLWSPRKTSSPCRLFQESRRIKERYQGCGNVKTSSPEKVHIVKSLVESSPPLKLRLGRMKKKREVQIPERAKGNAFHLGVRNSRSMIMACRAAITTISTLNAVCFCTGPAKLYEIL
ncbi:uncharacterized protein [Polyergus mexicanus]|uniref:uncharacterized protein n=1 Tax=Polyergus mexicanus TaxID=615972 RepID=UPI0038B4D5D5